MSGTSADGVDAALVDFSQPTPKLLACQATTYPSELKNRITQLYTPSHDEIERLGPLDATLGQFFAQCVNNLLAKTQVSASQITAIGSHGQTIRHRPRPAADDQHNAFKPFTLQIGDPNTLAYHTGITTVADFRRKDIAASGQGAPLTPAFHHAIFASTRKNRAVLNIGGIANITCLPTGITPTIGFDTGPGNGLMDAWIHATNNKPYDKNGDWARSGQPNSALLNMMLAHPYFELPTPKSTGREEFSIEWLNTLLAHFTDLTPKDVQATLLALTVTSIAQALKVHVPTQSDVYVCGGGIHNGALMKSLKRQLPAYAVQSTLELGVEPDWVEAMAFAWLAKQTLESLPGNEPSVTGAHKGVILGGIYPAG